MEPKYIIVITLILVIVAYTPTIYKINNRLRNIEARLDKIETNLQMNKDENGAK